MKSTELNKILKDHALWLNDSTKGNRADLVGADLVGADLGGANLWGADLVGADLRRADLGGADLRGADLVGADLGGANLPYFQIPEGDLIVYKKLQNAVIAKLLISRTTKRTASLIGRKCRSESAKVLEFINSEKKTEGGLHDSDFKYTVGKTVKADKYGDDIRVECSHGIHWFQTREEAENW